MTGDAPLTQAAPVIHPTAAVLHVRGERFLNSSDTISSFWRWIEDLVGLGLVLVWFGFFLVIWLT